MIFLEGDGIVLENREGQREWKVLVESRSKVSGLRDGGVVKSEMVLRAL